MTIKLSPNLTGAIRNVWSQIGSDLEAACAECGEGLTNDGAFESCLDADRIVLVARNQPAQDELNALYKEHGWNAVVKAAKKQIGRLV